MLADSKVDSLDTHLEQFKLNNQTAQNDLQNLLEEYSQLLDNYKDLKKTFETKRSSSVARSRPASTVTPEKPRNPYVLVLIDGNGYIFNDELIREKEEGGMRAARMLNDEVEKYIQQIIPESRTTRVVVKIYADLTNLSKQLAKSNVTGLEKRSLAPFSAAFTRAISLFDFVDALDEEGCKFKIREQFVIASEDSACSHILYAACHDSAYLAQLAPFSGARDKITLVQGASWNAEFHKFHLNVTQFPTVFRWSTLPTAAPVAKGTHTNGNTTPKPKPVPKKAAQTAPSGLPQHDSWRDGNLSPRGSVKGKEAAVSGTFNGVGTSNDISFNGKPTTSHKTSPQPCKYFQKGFCRFGTKCTFQHVPFPPNGTSQQPGPSTNRTSISAALPTTVAPGFIPLNKHAQRIDTYMRPPTQAEWSIYNARFHMQKPCNTYHLQRVCTVFGCPYDHHELEPESRHVLEYVLKCNPCPRKGKCRAADCYYGHICQKDGCNGQMKGCRMKADLHSVDPQMASTVLADNEEEEELAHGQAEGVGVQMPDESEYMW